MPSTSWDEDREAAVDTVHRMWPAEHLPGELNQILPTPAHSEQATELVTRQQVSESVPCGPDVEEHADAVRAYVAAGFDEVYVGQIGQGQEDFFAAYRAKVLPSLRG
ncbi:hypothetical protein [Streptomyces sp. NBC_01233]|uniref:hypothetical protein n=1 Tax=Streptomyces sp. NBC_01233 TaxID=2903787 RepID=UPI002E0EF192|nr:hypothetical protein OG332_43295 [Streptomyces sp. NBC_01233]